MKTSMLLMVRYDGLAVIPVEFVTRDYFQHLSPEKFIHKVDGGEIDIPLVRIEGSSKCQRGVPLLDLAAYLDARMAEARAVNDKIHGRRNDKRRDIAA
jgi:hypothetical protein